jgi:hypothetical protein
MKSRFSVKRAAGVLLSAGFLFVLVGDRGMTATPLGIDPLEVLNLQIKPNVIIVLDTSGSMNDSVGNNTLGADHPDSKTGGAKLVMRQALVNNETKVNMMFGTYTNTGSNFARTTVQASNNNQDHFSYWSDSGRFPSMAGAVAPNIQLTANQTYAFQIIGNGAAPNARTNNNLLYFTETAAPNAVCTATIPTRFYQSGGDLATAMAAAMNAATCTGSARANTYGVTYGVAGAGLFQFSLTAGARNVTMNWSTATNSIRAVLGAGTANQGPGTGPFNTGDARYRIMRRTTGTNFTEGTPAKTYYEMITGRFFNGETFYVQSNGNVCDMTAGPPSTTLPFVNLQLITGTTCPVPGAAYGTATGTLSGTAVRFDTAGGLANASSGGGWGGNGNSCGGFQLRSQLRACDNTTGQALAINTPFLEPEWRIATAAGAAPAAGIIGVVPGGLMNREETVEGVGRFDATGGNILPYGLTADGSTPIANSLSDLKPVFTRYYNGGGAIPATVGTVTPPTSGRIDQHLAPRERTIVLFITDGDDTCSGTGDAAARAAALKAQALYTPIVGGVQNPSGQYTAGTDAASSVITYIVGYGTGAQVTRLNMIAWGGSGMRTTFAANPTAADRLLCQTCQDAYVAPDPATLAAVLQSIFDQGAQTGEFTAQQSITGSIYEYVDQVPVTAPQKPFDARNPDNRYSAFTPVKFVSTFTLPGFNGQIKAFTNSCNIPPPSGSPAGTPFSDAATGLPCTTGDTSLLLWSAGDKLLSSVSTGMTNTTGCPIASNPGAVDGECLFTQLHAGATDATIGTSAAAIKRRIYTTSQNGYFGVTIANLLAGAAPFRISLWPPQATAPAVAPAVLTEGLFDDAMGLPLDAAASPATEFANLQTKFRVCLGTIPASTANTNCNSASALTKMQQARREAREIILAYMAGATPVIDNLANPQRVTSGANAGLILFRAKSWILAESSLATPAEVPPPFGSPTATPYTKEYDLFRDGDRVGGTNTASGDNTLARGFGLANPDRDAAPKDLLTGQDTRAAIKPVMSVIYAGANDMLHAFRAGSAYSLGTNRTGSVCGSQITVAGQKQMTSATSATVPDCGGDELWGFVPFDQLGKLYTRVVNNPIKRDPHDYVVARGVRFADVFVPGQTPLDFGNGTVTLQGVWRKILYVPRGIAGKYMTAIDVTSPGTFKTPFLQTTGPIPLWSRGNPDTTNGKPTGAAVNSAVDTAAYAAMGETWSLPAVVYVEKTQNLTIRKPGGVDFVAYMGSGYGSTASEGTRIYSVDALTGDVIGAPDVEPVATANGLSRGARSAPGTPPVPYNNAIVANVVAFNQSNFKTLTTAHPSASKATRVYVGDLYGRFWKMLTATPNVVLPMADLEDTAVHQPVSTAASIIGLPLDQLTPAPTPYVYVTTGNDNREPGPFKIYGFRDDGDDTNVTVAPVAVLNNVKTFGPVVSLFTREYDQGPVLNPLAPQPFPVFRGTDQPATAFTADKKGVVFFAGTRFNPPLSAFAPQPVPGNAATYPCRSTFDSIIYSLQAASGNAAYDLNATGDDAYAIFQDSRVVGIGMQADPEPGRGGSRFSADEGQRKPGTQEFPPPKPGKPPAGGSNVRLGYRADHPMPAMKFGSTVCQ